MTTRKRKKLIIVDEIPKSRYYETKLQMDCNCGSKLSLSSVSKVSFIRHMKCHRHVSICGRTENIEEAWVQFKSIHFDKLPSVIPPPKLAPKSAPEKITKKSNVCSCGKICSIYIKKYNFIRHIKSNYHTSRVGVCTDTIQAWKNYKKLDDEDDDEDLFYDCE